MKKLALLLFVVLGLSGCITVNNKLPNDELTKTEAMVKIMIQSPADDLTAKTKQREHEVFERIANRMSRLECLSIESLQRMSVQRAFQDEVMNGDGIDPMWVAAFIRLIKKFEPEAEVAITPRKMLGIIPGPSVNLTVKVGKKERSYIIAPMSTEYFLCEEEEQ